MISSQATIRRHDKKSCPYRETVSPSSAAFHNIRPAVPFALEILSGFLLFNIAVFDFSVPHTVLTGHDAETNTIEAE